MNNIWVMGDHHLGHGNVLKFSSNDRPFSNIEEHNRELIVRHNSVVKPKDTCYFMGDVAFSRDALSLISEFNGIRKLVLGNHDKYSIEEYLQVFHKVYAHVQYRDAILTHIPIHPSQLEFRFNKNIHGHMHADKIDDNRYVCVSAEQTNLTPVLLRSLL